jgi:hypothetical protein
MQMSKMTKEYFYLMKTRENGRARFALSFADTAHENLATFCNPAKIH